MRTKRSKARPTSLITRTSCRICGSPHLAPVLSLGDHHIAGAFADPKRGGGHRAPRTARAGALRHREDQEACGLLQTRHTVPGAILYRSYWYRSGINRTMTENLHGSRSGRAARRARAGRPRHRHRLQRRHAARRLRHQGPRILGFDPSDVSRYAVEKGYEVVRNFFTAPAAQARYPEQKAKVITSIAMFYDLEDPASSSGDSTMPRRGRHLGDRAPYMPTMLAKNSFDTIVHEHLEYYSLAVSSGCSRAGLEASRRAQRHQRRLDPALREPRGQRQPTPEDFAALQDLRVKEFELALDAAEPYSAPPRVQRVRDELRALLEQLARRGQEGPRLRRVDQGQHDPAVGIDATDRVRRRPQPRQVGLGDDRDRHPDHLRGGVARDKARLLPRAALALPRRVPRAREGVPRPRGQVHRPAPRGPRGRRLRAGGAGRAGPHRELR